MFALWHRDVHGAPGQVIDLADLRAAVLAARPPVARLRPARARSRAGPAAAPTGRRPATPTRRATGGGSGCRRARSRSPSGSCAWSATRRSSTSRGSATTTAASRTRRSSTSTSAAGSRERDYERGRWPRSRRQQAVIGPIYSIADIFEDPQYQARDTITTVDDPKLGRARVQNAIPRLTATPGRVRHLGGDLGQDNHAVLVDELGMERGGARAAPRARYRRRTAASRGDRAVGVETGQEDPPSRSSRTSHAAPRSIPRRRRASCAATRPSRCGPRPASGSSMPRESCAIDPTRSLAACGRGGRHDRAGHPEPRQPRLRRRHPRHPAGRGAGRQARPGRRGGGAADRRLRGRRGRLRPPGRRRLGRRPDRRLRDARGQPSRRTSPSRASRSCWSTGARPAITARSSWTTWRGSRMAVEHLAWLGHERIGFVGLEADTDTARRRRQGYLDGLAAAGLAVRRALARAGGPADRAGRSRRRRRLLARGRPRRPARPRCSWPAS